MNPEKLTVEELTKIYLEEMVSRKDIKERIC